MVLYIFGDIVNVPNIYEFTLDYMWHHKQSH